MKLKAIKHTFIYRHILAVTTSFKAAPVSLSPQKTRLNKTKQTILYIINDLSGIFSWRQCKLQMLTTCTMYMVFFVYVLYIYAKKYYLHYLPLNLYQRKIFLNLHRWSSVNSLVLCCSEVFGSGIHSQKTYLCIICFYKNILNI